MWCDDDHSTSVFSCSYIFQIIAAHSTIKRFHASCLYFRLYVSSLYVLLLNNCLVQPACSGYFFPHLHWAVSPIGRWIIPKRFLYQIPRALNLDDAFHSCTPLMNEQVFELRSIKLVLVTFYRIHAYQSV